MLALEAKLTSLETCVGSLWGGGGHLGEVSGRRSCFNPDMVRTLNRLRSNLRMGECWVAVFMWGLPWAVSWDHPAPSCGRPGAS
eukprot:1672940-Pyramimonas_sp.AAC.1